MSLLEIAAYAAIFLLASFSFAFFLKKKLKAQVILRIISIIRSKKPLAFFEKFAKFKRFLHWFANIGLIIGFGSIAIDYLYARGLSKPKRIIVFLASFTELYLILYLVLSRIQASAMLAENFVLILSSFAFFGLAGFTIVLLGINAVDIIAKTLIGEKALPGIAPIIPGVKIPNVPIFVPLHGWLSLLIILVIHESAHGIIARMHKIKLKTAGIILFGFLPLGAFVEPDEKKFEKEKPLKKMQVLSAGSMANIALFAIALGVFTILFSALITPFILPNVVVAGVKEYSVVNGENVISPAFGKLHAGDTVLEINGVKVSSVEQLSSMVKESQVLNFKIKTAKGLVKTISVEKNPAGVIGAFFEQPFDEKMPPFNVLIVEFFFWLFMLNLFVAIANFMPVEPFDGGKIAKIMLAPYLGFLKMPEKETEKFVSRAFIWIIGLILLVNALPLFQF